MPTIVKFCALTASLAVVAGLILGSPAPLRGSPPAAAVSTGLSASSQAAAFSALQGLLGSDSSMGQPPASAAAAILRGLPHAAKPADTGVCAGAPDINWLHTDGVWIEDDNNCKVRLEGVTWFGMQTSNFVPAGLDFQPMWRILAEIKALGFNSIRIPFSDEMVRFNSSRKIKHFVKRNPAFLHQHPLTVLDALVQGAMKDGLFVILDNHGSYARNYASETGVGPALWTQPGYSTQNWINDWLTLARRYKSDQNVMGFDLRNEPHTNGPGPWSLKAYLTQGATWGRYPDSRWKKKTDWPAAATKCANAILKVNPNLLMFIEGVELYPDPKAVRGADYYWWGSILRGVATDPIVLNVPNRVVYSPHEWGPWKYNSPQFYDNPTYKSMTKLFYKEWAFILDTQKYPKINAPIWLGEFNTCDAAQLHPTTGIKVKTAHDCVFGTKAGKEGWWFQFMINYLKNNPEIGWSYYALNGTNGFDQPANNGLMNPHWTGVGLKPIMTMLRKVQTQPVQ